MVFSKGEGANTIKSTPQMSTKSDVHDRWWSTGDTQSFSFAVRGTLAHRCGVKATAQIVAYEVHMANTLDFQDSKTIKIKVDLVL